MEHNVWKSFKTNYFFKFILILKYVCKDLINDDIHNGRYKPN